MRNTRGGVMVGIALAGRRSRRGLILVLMAALTLTATAGSALRAPHSALAQPVIFGDGLLPAPGSTVRFSSDSGGRSRAVSLDGRPLTLKSEGAGAGSEVLAASVPLGAGPHVAVASAVDGLGRPGSAQWSFLASGAANTGNLRITP